ncbi:KTSC domain-containing protein [Sinorhizobium meliloti]|uniref:KTSC domain-containing protein n=1 Tax=Rhizobium meliloti TaxID=382 RepID=UPI0012965133|nr:KTSC domain-containing protein [Sinorhizobium meliloti]MDW9593529.1 KTSC domain-containing protein [Sinorhizobium meliloti]MDX0189781.1 KTSC domain-containing protein [Sinorhizobium meliloti]MQV09051.1 KTSC domain-containing protein [Sinorhizobium meliloti]
MERQPVSSSSLASVGYDPASETLQVEFVATGKVYEYYNVPQFMYDRLVEAASIGQFFNAEIRNAYSSNPI